MNDIIENGSSEGNNSDIDSIPPSTSRKKRLVGFAAMDKDKVRKIASAGGKAVHEKGTGHKFSKDEAKVAGSKGGKAPRKRKKVGQ